MTESAPVKLFVAYRRKDAAGDARLLHDRLARRFGAESVFLDVISVAAGSDWRRELRAGERGCAVLLVLMGASWAAILRDSAQRALVAAADDVARQEIELGLSDPCITVVPVLLDEAQMPAAHELPRSLAGLADCQAVRLRHESYDADVDRLIARLEEIAAAPPPAPPAPPRPVVRRGSHHERVASLLLGAGPVVAILGPDVNAGRDPLPSADALAADLARRFSYEPQSVRPRLAEVAEYVHSVWGGPDLYHSVKEHLPAEFRPAPVHTFLAELPAALAAAGARRRPQLLLTTNYDTALERAFEEAGEPYDLAVYTAHTRRFTHLGWDSDEPVTIDEPNAYSGFPIYDDLELARTVIVKLHGAVGNERLRVGEDDYVITEDNYIEYLSGAPVAEIVPVQILQLLTGGHCLFLGYDIGSWYLRVLLSHVWRGRFRAASWAVDEHAGELERMLWRELGAEVVTEPLDDYVEELRGCVSAGR